MLNSKLQGTKDFIFWKITLQSISNRCTSMVKRVYRILHLIPDRLIEGNKLLKIQKNYSKTFIEGLVIPTFINTTRLVGLEESLTDFEKIFSGLINTVQAPQEDVIGRVASLWYAFTKTSHASLGPRVGNFTEQLIGYWIEKYKGANVYINANLHNYFRKSLGIPLEKSRRRIDFIIEDSTSGTLSLIELRESEHTGGRTGQESLMDKLTEVLQWIEDPRITLRNSLTRVGFNKLELVIAILFSERDRKLLTEDNYSEGRFTSLRDYILDKRHIGGVLKVLIDEYGYEISLDKGKTFTKIKYDKHLIDRALKSHRKISLKSDNFIIDLSILWGNEFFLKYIGKTFHELISETSKEIADDVWLFFSVAINEFKIYREFDETNIHKLYHFIRTNRDLVNEFKALYNDQNIKSVNEYFERLDRIIRNYISEFMRYAERKAIKLRLLETNEFMKQYIYLKQLCLVALSTYYLKHRGHFVTR